MHSGDLGAGDEGLYSTILHRRLRFLKTMLLASIPTVHHSDWHSVMQTFMREKFDHVLNLTQSVKAMTCPFCPGFRTSGCCRPARCHLLYMRPKKSEGVRDRLFDWVYSSMIFKRDWCSLSLHWIKFPLTVSLSEFAKIYDLWSSVKRVGSYRFTQFTYAIEDGELETTRGFQSKDSVNVGYR